MRVATYSPVHGTWARKERHLPTAWYNPTAEFARYHAQFGIVHSCPDEPFTWDGRINGAQGWRRWFSNNTGDHLDWVTSGDALRWHSRARGVADIYYGHSHGGNVLGYACANGLRIKVLVTIATPVRKDMEAVWKLARPNIGYWIHLHAMGDDWMQLFGQIGDGIWSPARQMIYRDKTGRVTVAADQNYGLPLIQHSRMVSDPTCMPMWKDRGIIDTILSQL